MGRSKKRSKFETEIVATLLILTLTCVSALGPLAGQEPTPETVVAVVNGTKISYGEFRVDDDQLRVRFRGIYRRNPETPVDFETFEKMRLQSEESRLRHRIEQIVRHEKVREFGITVSEEEVARMKAKIAERQPPEASADRAEEYEAYMLALLEALKAVQSRRLDERQAYDRYLKSHSSFTNYEGWRQQVHQYDSPEQMRLLEKILLGFHQMGPRQAVEKGKDIVAKYEVETLKLDKEIFARLSEKDSVIRRYYEALESGDEALAGELREKHEGYLEWQKLEWWKEQFRAADVQIFVEKFAGLAESWKPFTPARQEDED